MATVLEIILISFLQFRLPTTSFVQPRRDSLNIYYSNWPFSDSYRIAALTSTTAVTGACNSYSASTKAQLRWVDLSHLYFWFGECYNIPTSQSIVTTDILSCLQDQGRVLYFAVKQPHYFNLQGISVDIAVVFHCHCHWNWYQQQQTYSVHYFTIDYL